ncbi:MAG TPA: 3'(2'),5'-bisphosphate nucleotidase CysQ [Candidatus Limnocylindrales bacterium]|nr:3'(2'),5'-bisphosphate nucleotidase CysQ [Candidatus Limnocylindrales bacterium]
MIDASPLDLDLDTATDARLAAALAAGAGARLLELRRRLDGSDFDADDLRRTGDRSGHEYLAARLAEHRPGDAVLSEEAVDDGRRLVADRVWIVDPLDGTREFAERREDGSWRDDFAVHVALWQRGRGLTDGAVALPARSRVYASDEPATVGGSPAEEVLAGRRRLRLAASRTRPPEVVRRLVERGDAELVAMGSCGIKAISVLEGVADAYIHAGGQFEWDSAAPVAVVTAGGLVATRLDGSPLEYNRADPSLPDLLVCRPRLVSLVRELVETVAAEATAG